MIISEKFISFSEFEEKKTLEEKERLCSFAKEIIAITKNPHNYIDEGGAAKIYKLHDCGACIKLIRYTPLVEQSTPYGRRRTPEEEAHFLDRLSRFSFSNVRSPHYFQGLFHPKKSALIMEQLPAVNLQHAINDPKLFPQSFDYETFFDNLEDYISELHTNQKIIHGDLFARNIMIDNTTGNPYVIDFGRSEYLTEIPEETRQQKLQQKEWSVFDDMKTTVQTVLTKNKSHATI